MKKILLILLLAFSFNISASDWQYAGTSSIKNATEVIFIDKSSIAKNKDVIRFWTKSITQKILDDFGDKDKNNKRVETIANLIASGYKPDVFYTPSSQKIISNTKDLNLLLANLLLYQDYANKENLPIKLKVFWELDCKNKTSTALETTLFNTATHSIEQLSKQKSTGYISPDSNFQAWAEMLCN